MPRHVSVNVRWAGVSTWDMWTSSWPKKPRAFATMESSDQWVLSNYHALVNIVPQVYCCIG